VARHRLEVDGLHGGYGAGDILQGVSLRVEPGEIVAVIGRNGVGKTTLMRTLMGLVRASAGTMRFGEEELTRTAVQARAGLGIGYVPQGKQIFPDLTVQENLRMGERINGGQAVDHEVAYAYFPRLRERLAQKGGTLSGGEQQALAIARALVGSPDLLLLDEPSESVQPSIVQQIGDVLLRLKDERGLTILLVEQNASLIESVAERGYVMEKGRTIAELGQTELRDAALMHRYLAI
jgi:urea ABC transporter ATP-binding protein UrtE